MFYDVFPYSFVLMVYIAYLTSFFVHETIPIDINVYCYNMYSYSQIYCSFSILFLSSDYWFLLNAYSYYQFIFCSVSINMLR